MREAVPGCDACVVGAGVMGASTAFHLARAGLDVVILERGTPGREASGANAGTLAVQNKPLGAVPAVIESLGRWETLSEELDFDVHYERRGGFRVAHSDEDLERLERESEAQRQQGARTEMVYGAALHREAPYLHPEIRAASYSPLDGMANPFLAVRAFIQAAERLGARVEADREVLAIEDGGDQGFLLRTSRGPLRASRVVSAAGVWNRRVAAMVGVELPIRTLVQQAMITTSLAPLFRHIVTHVRGHLTLKQQQVSGKVQIGGGWPGAGTAEEGVSTLRRKSMQDNIRVAVATVPGLRHAQLLRAWTGFEGRTPDKLLASGPVGPDGFFVVGCASGGFTISPIGGEIVADQILGRTPRVPAEPFQPTRLVYPGPRSTAVASSAGEC